MDRRGVYRKGSAGHARNVGSYRLYMQNFKKWRRPMTGLLAVILIFGLAPRTGDLSQTSILTAEQAQVFADMPAEEVKKALMESVKAFADECAKFKMEECGREGNELLQGIAGAEIGVGESVSAAVEYEDRFSAALSSNVCRYELSRNIAKLRAVSRQARDFAAEYEILFSGRQLEGAIASTDSAAAQLSEFVKSCESQ